MGFFRALKGSHEALKIPLRPLRDHKSPGESLSKPLDLMNAQKGSNEALKGFKACEGLKEAFKFLIEV